MPGSAAMKRFFKPKEAAGNGAGGFNGQADRRSFQVDAQPVPNKAGVTPFPVDLGREPVSQPQMRDRERDREREREREWEWKRQQQQRQHHVDETEPWSVIPPKPNGATPRTPPTGGILSPTPISQSEAYPPPQPTFYLPPGASPPSPQLSSTPPPNSTYRAISKQHSIPNISLADHNARPNSQIQFPTPVPHGARYASPQSPVTSLPNPHPPAPQQQQMYQPPPPIQQGSFGGRPSADMARPPTEKQPKDKDGKKDKKFFGIDWGSGKDKEAKKEKEREKEREREMRERESEDSHGQNSAASHQWQAPPLPPQHVQHQHHQSQQYQQQPSLQQYVQHPHAAYRDPAMGVRAAADVGTAIRDICAMAPASNIPAIADLCDRVNHSDSPDSVVKDAARAIRKEFKHGSEPAKVAAARIWLWMMGNCSSRGFKSYASSKKFLGSLEPLLLAPPGKALVSGPTQQVLTEVLAGLVYQYGNDKGCEGLRDLWLKVKLPQDNEMGYLLPTDHWIFDNVPASLAPPARPHRNSDPPSRSQSNPALQQLTAQAQVSDGPGIYPGPPPPRPTKATPPFGGPTYNRLADPKEDLRKLLEECTAAKESARVLSEALVYTKPDELDEKDVIKEFHAKCVRAQMSMMDQMAWASSLADKSKSRRERDEPTAEEEAFASLIDANEQLAEVLRLHEEMEKLARDERDMQAAEERSRREMRLDRSHAARLVADGQLAPPNATGGAASRSPSPRMRPLADAPNARPDTPSSEDHPPLPPPPRVLPENPRSASPRTGGPRPLPNPFKTVVAPSRGDSGAESSEESVSQLPAKPSSKALGKRRAPPQDDAPKFDTDDLFRDQSQQDAPPKTPIESDAPTKPIVYAYDAYEDYQKERQRMELDRQRQDARPVTRGPGGGSSMIAEETVPTAAVTNLSLSEGIPTPRTASPTSMLAQSAQMLAQANAHDQSDALADDGVRRKTSILSRDGKWGRWRK